MRAQNWHNARWLSWWSVGFEYFLQQQCTQSSGGSPAAFLYIISLQLCRTAHVGFVQHVCGICSRISAACKPQTCLTKAWGCWWWCCCSCSSSSEQLAAAKQGCALHDSSCAGQLVLALFSTSGKLPASRVLRAISRRAGQRHEAVGGGGAAALKCIIGSRQARVSQTLYQLCRTTRVGCVQHV